ncbi:TIGR04282 family arsenosugar biosynthesis glycosyltransferase [Actinocrinis puniceicyclus]|uniref:TIGR04282 family arsenosugar biosynthesis glycosyltransferase n=1 Tax=Actinocrinis puniceicyclus TaxID=977794 RepID=A0A8J8BCX5_9ACTN|nr:TIGR04282 family arsenosugar biosynthesis glycosyltransferase [Actinocrinis puniceicyclus]MBS2963546.1 TIGR04282 family arsenosugar biosynthesis glycosyltransferase [Actinocrinis puniceicyclus]
MAKAPLPGLAKTRLHPLLGPEGCARLQAALSRHTLATALATGRRVVLAFDPPDAHSEISRLIDGLGALKAVPQRDGHLGERMTTAAADALPDGGPLVVIGTDAPALTAGLLDQAFAALETAPASVIGPALDGGYYLLGVRWPAPDVFAIDPALWGGEHVAATTMARLRRLPGCVTQLPTLRDLDTPEDATALIRDPALPPEIAHALVPSRTQAAGP